MSDHPDIERALELEDQLIHANELRKALPGEIAKINASLSGQARIEEFLRYQRPIIRYLSRLEGLSLCDGLPRHAQSIREGIRVLVTEILDLLSKEIRYTRREIKHGR
jgi:hypothetical protein